MTSLSLEERLSRPARLIPLDALPSAWFHSVIELRCQGASELGTQQNLPGKIRGALGEALKLTASQQAVAGQPCPWSPPSALDVLFRCQGKITPALEIPKPYVLAVYPDGDDLLIRLTLFGFASDWTEMVSEALVRAVRGPISIERSLEIIDRRYWSQERVVCRTTGIAAIVFQSPLQIRQGQQRVRLDLPTLVANLGNRISSLARWQDAAVDASWSDLKVHAGRLQVVPLEQQDHQWSRFSRKQRRRIPIEGECPAWLIRGSLGPILPLLAIGAVTHAGGRATLGLGRYELEVDDREQTSEIITHEISALTTE